MARMIAEKVASEGGRAFYVGGLVRDHILGRENKDVDIEIHGITPEKLEEILETFGEVTKTGMSFGVFGLKKYEIDIAMPRKEKAVGRGHRDFEIDVDPFIGYEKAALRRDFTMNAMMEDVLSGEILDFFGGREDMKKHLIRHVNDVTYQEDALRVLRAAQFAARFQFEIADETRELSRTMSLTDLAPERIFGELHKALLKAREPSIFFEEMRHMGHLSLWFPELEALIGLGQNLRFHPEGDVWIHTMQVLDEAAALRAGAKEPLYFMLSALCHDMGKAVTTQEIGGVLHAYQHEQAGLPLVQTFLGRMTRETKLMQYVLNMTELHMKPNMLVDCRSSVKSYMKMYDRSLCPEDLLLLARADNLGCAGPGSDREAMCAEYAQTERQLRDMLALYYERMSRPCLMGRDLIEAGFTPGPLFAEALAGAHKLRLAGRPKEEQFKYALSLFRKESEKM